MANQFRFELARRLRAPMKGCHYDWFGSKTSSLTTTLDFHLH